MVGVFFGRIREFRPVTMWYRNRHATIDFIRYIDTDEDITGVGSKGGQHILMYLIRQRLIGRDLFNIDSLLQNSDCCLN